MKKFNKILAVALVVVMLIMTSVTAFADRPLYEMAEGERCYIEVPAGDYEGWYFVPEYDGCYIIDTWITSDCDYADPIVTVYEYYDGEYYEIAYNDDCYYLEAAACFYGYEGETYYIDFSDYSDEHDTTYEAEINSGCLDSDYDGYCNGCWDRLCYCGCHDNGFFWRIRNFFNRLFRINEVCACGAYHW